MSKQATESLHRFRTHLKPDHIQFTIASLDREREYHERRLLTLTLAIDAMKNELERIEHGPHVPPEIVAATEDVKATYARQAP